jgi:hypothetical protein
VTDSRRVTVGAYAIALVSILFLFGCALFTRTSAKLLPPASQRAAICPEAVVFFTGPSAVGKAYVEVAQLWQRRLTRA